MLSRLSLPPMWLLIAAVALPQIGETIFAPSLPDLAQYWHLNAATTQWVLGIFFFAFAPGVWLWGQVADRFGRRPALVGGLALALLGTLVCHWAPEFWVLLLGRAIQALGLATCSVTTQTVLRDRLQGAELVRGFVSVGIVLSWSPAVGPLLGQLLSDWHGYHAVVAALSVLTALVLLNTVWLWPETRVSSPPQQNRPSPPVLHRMLRDPALYRAVILIAGMNIVQFSFYSAGPFFIGHLPGLGFGWIGLGVALTGSLGAAVNYRLPAHWLPALRVRYGTACMVLGVVAQAGLVFSVEQPGVWWALPVFLVFVGSGLAVSNLLGAALKNYSDCLGRAGALFGLSYYLLIGAGLGATSLLSFASPRPLACYWLAIMLLMVLVQCPWGRLLRRKQLELVSVGR